MSHKATHREFLFISPYHTYSKRTFLCLIVEKEEKTLIKFAQLK